MLFFPAIVVVFITTVHACIDDVLWRDTFGWTCRDYNRDPLECHSNYAVSEGGIEAQEACCACKTTVERRRDLATCLGACSADEDACQADCKKDSAECRFDCSDQFPPTVIGPEPSPAPVTGGNGLGGLDTWVIVLIIIGVVLFLCIICVILYFLFMTPSEGTCEDDEYATQQPMLIGGGCDAPPCDAPCDNQVAQPAYGQPAYGQASGYPQQGGW